MSKSSLGDALGRFLASLHRSRELAGTVSAQAEDQLKGPVQVLLDAAGASLGLRVETRTEVHVADVAGRPDIGVLVGGLLCGYVELKSPGKGARVERLKGADKEQWGRFRALPNLIYTDGLEWALYRKGERNGTVVYLSDSADGDAGPDRESVRTLSVLLHDFLRWEPIVPASPKGLAELLAPLCGVLREEVLDALAASGSSVAQIAAEWREALFPDADDRQFADAYAQTLTYALLLARFEGGVEVDADSAQKILERKHGLLARSLRILGDPQVRREIGLGVALLERSINAIDLAALRQRGGDPWLYFYEDFLAAYDPKLRNDRGVYYTPVDVIRVQCRLIEQLLREHFNKQLGLADEGVVLLDPAAGTGAYLLAAIEMGLARVAEQQGPGAVPAWASVLAQNVHGFEILVGPYAVAHLRLTQAILAAGGDLPADGVHMYLSDTLENPYAKELSRLSIVHRPLADEHKRARRVKSETAVLVCLGNPPYDRQQIDIDDARTERKGGWVRHGEHGADALLNDFIEPARQAGMGVHLKNLYNDYVYFWRWALWKVFEEKKEPHQSAQAGIVSFITAASYLRGPGFVGMRKVMREIFDELWIIDLEGDRLGTRKSENVFAILRPVAIALGVRYAAPQQSQPARVHYTRIAGSRTSKLEQLAGITRFEDVEWRECFEDWTAPFLPRTKGGFFDWPALTDLFPWQHPGIQLKRTWPIGETKEVLEQRWRALLAAKDAERADAFRETSAWRISQTYAPLPGMPEQRQAIVSLQEDAEPAPLVRLAHRSLDRKWIFADARLGDRMRPPLWAAHGEKQVYMTSLLTEVLGLGPAAMVCAPIPDLHHFRGSFGGKDVIPLWRDAQATVPNVTHGLLEAVSRSVGARIGAEDLFAYCYGILATPAYVERFWDELTLPGPRIPMTTDVHKFRNTVKLGRRLVRLHTYGERFTTNTAARWQGHARCVKPIPSKPEAYPDDFTWDPGTKTLHVGEGELAPVRREVWDFSVSGAVLVTSWLGCRMRDRAGRSSSPLDDIRPVRWTAAMTQELLELLWVIEATVDLAPELERNLADVVAGPLLRAEMLPTPAGWERRPPLDDQDDENPAQARLPT